MQILSNDQTLAYCIGLNVVGEITLMDIGVDKASQGQGVGRKMLNYFIAHAIDIKGTEVWLEVRQGNHKAIGLYTSSGFELIETRKNYYKHSSSALSEVREDALIMKKTL